MYPIVIWYWQYVLRKQHFKWKVSLQHLSVIELYYYSIKLTVSPSWNNPIMILWTIDGSVCTLYIVRIASLIRCLVSNCIIKKHPLTFTLTNNNILSNSNLSLNTQWYSYHSVQNKWQYLILFQITTWRVKVNWSILKGHSPQLSAMTTKYGCFAVLYKDEL